MFKLDVRSGRGEGGESKSKEREKARPHLTFVAGGGKKEKSMTSPKHPYQDSKEKKKNVKGGKGGKKVTTTHARRR